MTRKGVCVCVSYIENVQCEQRIAAIIFAGMMDVGCFATINANTITQIREANNKSDAGDSIHGIQMTLWT